MQQFCQPAVSPDCLPPRRRHAFWLVPSMPPIFRYFSLIYRASPPAADLFMR